jgi:hypothetical protein
MAVSQVSRATQQSTDGAVAGLYETHAILPVQFFFQSATVRTARGMSIGLAVGAAEPRMVTEQSVVSTNGQSRIVG